MEKMFYSMGEVTDILGVPASTVRYWSDKFEKYVKPIRTAKGNRQFKAEGVEVLKQINHLTGVEGLTLEGVARELRDSRRAISADVRVLESLKDIRAQLVEISKLI